MTDNNEDKDVFIRITNKDIYAELKQMHKTVEDVLEQARYTNGRVTKLERKSLGLWVERNPIKFTIIIVALVSVFAIDAKEGLSGILNLLL